MNAEARMDKIPDMPNIFCNSESEDEAASNEENLKDSGLPESTYNGSDMHESNDEMGGDYDDGSDSSVSHHTSDDECV